MPRIGASGLGWRRDLPDPRDYGPNHPAVAQLFAPLFAQVAADKDEPHGQIAAASLPSAIDLRGYFPPVSDQSAIHTSVAHACVSMVEYFERRSHGRTTRLSTLFLHHCTQKLQGIVGEAGTDLRAALKALVRFGLPPEYQWPYEPNRFARDPDPFLHTYACDESYRSIVYLRLDFANATGTETLHRVRQFLAAGFPVTFGVVVPSSVAQDANFLYRPTFDSFQFGQAFVAVGYDDHRLHVSRGSLLVRSAWGDRWGEQGYGWLPYEFLQHQLAVDFWTIVRQDWLGSGEFQIPHRALPNPTMPRSSQSHDRVHPSI